MSEYGVGANIGGEMVVVVKPKIDERVKALEDTTQDLIDNFDSKVTDIEIAATNSGESKQLSNWMQGIVDNRDKVNNTISGITSLVPELKLGKIYGVSELNTNPKATVQGIARKDETIFFAGQMGDAPVPTATEQRIYKYNTKTGEYSYVDTTNLGHAGAMTIVGDELFIPDNKEQTSLYVYALDLSFKRKIDFAYKIICVAFDQIHNKFYILKDYNGISCTVSNLDMSDWTEKSSFVVDYGKFGVQDFHVYNGLFFMAGAYSNGLNIIKVYQDGKNIKTYTLGYTYGEIESVYVSGHGVDVACNSRVNQQVCIYNAYIFNNEGRELLESPIAVGAYEPEVVYPASLTLYVDSSANGFGDGSQEKPFRRFKDVLDYLYMNQRQRRYVIVHTQGNFEAERDIQFRGLAGYYNFQGSGVFASMNFTGCDCVVLNGITCSGKDTSTEYCLQIEGGSVAIEGKISLGNATTKKNYGLWARCTKLINATGVNVQNCNTGVRAYMSYVGQYNANSYTNCTSNHVLQYSVLHTRGSFGNEVSTNTSSTILTAA